MVQLLFRLQVLLQRLVAVGQRRIALGGGLLEQRVDLVGLRLRPARLRLGLGQCRIALRGARQLQLPITHLGLAQMMFGFLLAPQRHAPIGQRGVAVRSANPGFLRPRRALLLRPLVVRFDLAQVVFGFALLLERDVAFRQCRIALGHGPAQARLRFLESVRGLPRLLERFIG